MERFLIAFKLEIVKPVQILITTSPRSSCPLACPLRKGSAGDQAGVCYAEHGHLGHYIWTGLDRTKAGQRISGRIPVYSFDELLLTVRNLPPDMLWRHNQAGDLPSDDQMTISRLRLLALVTANSGRRGFTSAHFDVLSNEENRLAIAKANANGFTINLSADSLAEADKFAALEMAPDTVVLPSDMMRNTATPEGRKVVICPAITHENVTCATCALWS
ncbi:DUF7227 family protein [Bradyrhizobium sp. CCBAU 25360]|uniref:DUF7227 family protein n=1 Tax=Bradyrhizobium sp. CCBAU 25360 TaxID=858425 RepID=UPI002305B128|nr:hypothetical protein [Bradyrhizobium sp. CCBAU 25360]